MTAGGTRARMATGATESTELARGPVAAWLAVALWAGVVLGLGSDAFAHRETSRFLLPLLRWLLPEAEPATLALLLGALRKLAHVLEYGVLGILAYRALRLSLRAPLWGHLLLATLLLGALASFDEARQARSAVRSGRVADVGLDLVGGLAGAIVGVSLGRAPRTRRWFPTPPRRM